VSDSDKPKDAENPKPDAGPVFYEIREYACSDGRRITAHVPLDGSPVTYIGHATGPIKDCGRAGRFEFTFTIPAETIEQAFEQMEAGRETAYPKALEAVQAQLAEAARARIALPGMPQV